MNLYAAIIVGTILLSYVLDLLADGLNLNALQSQLPEEFESE